MVSHRALRGRVCSVVLMLGSALAPASAQCGPDWALAADTGPAPRFARAMTYDPDRQVCLLFGGAGGTQVFGDTWTWDGSAWSLAATTGPAPRWKCPLVYDRARSRAVLFGGSTPPQPGQVLADTWEWDGAAWIERFPATSPPARRRHAMAYDEARGVTVLFGGDTPNVPTDGRTWTWDGTTWSIAATEGPSLRHHVEMAYDPDRRVVVLFGGATETDQWLGDTWEWDGVSWTPRPVPGPSPRGVHAMTYDPVRRAVLVFGGYHANYAPLGDTWSWDGETWTLLATTGPAPRGTAGLAFDEARSQAVLFGGAVNGTSTTVFGDTWAFGDSACPADLDGSGFLTLADFLLFLNLYGAGDSRSDFNCDGNGSVQDLLAFLRAYAAGCP